MPAIAAITINNGEATPVAITFDPVAIDSNRVAEYVHREADTAPIGFSVIKLSNKVNGSGSYHIKMTFNLPTLETPSAGATVSGYVAAPRVAFSDRCNIEFIISGRSTAPTRQDLLAYAKNFLGTALATSLVVDLESVYG